MQSTKPYMIRAMYQWCIDQGFTPFVVAHVDQHTRVPPGYAKDEQIVLNLGLDATHQMLLENDYISFQARFNGVAQSIVIPVGNVLAIYARENGHGMQFALETDVIEADDENLVADQEVDPEQNTPEEPPPRPRGGGHLKVVK